jgi:hypothetical protein
MADKYSFLEYYRDRYFKSIERRDKIKDEINFPASLVGGYIGLAIYYFQNLPELRVGWIYCLFYLSVAPIVLVVFMAIWHLKEAFRGIYSKSIAYPSELNKTKEALENYYREIKKKNIQKMIKADFDRMFENQYSEAIEYIERENQVKAQALFMAKRYIVVGILPAVFSASLFATIKYENREDQRIQISAWPKEMMVQFKSEDQSKSAPDGKKPAVQIQQP